MLQRYVDAAKWVLLSAGIFIAGAVAGSFAKHPFEKIGDLATWVGAFGTILAFSGTIWLATSQERRRRRDATDVAQLVAGRVIGDIEVALRNAYSVNAWLTFMCRESGFTPIPTSIGRVVPVTEGRIDSVDTLTLLVPLPNNAAHRIARAVGMLRNVDSQIADFLHRPEHWRGIDDSGRKYYIDLWIDRINKAIDFLRMAHDDCVAAANVGAPEPSLEQLYGSDD